MSHRVAQIESMLRRAIAGVLSQRLSDPRVEGMVSVMRVTVSPDLHDAYVFVSVLPERYEKKSLNGLRHAAGHVHAEVCKVVDMNHVPRLDFRLDQTLKKEATVLDAIRRGGRSKGQSLGLQDLGSEEDISGVDESDRKDIIS